MKEIINKIKEKLDNMESKEFPCDNSEQNTGYLSAVWELKDFIESSEDGDADSNKAKIYTFLCRTVNNRLGYCDCGYANGYVAIPPGHPMHGKHYDDVDVDVHWGLTFCTDKKCIKDWTDIEFINFSSFDEIPDDYWVFGFDTMHHGDNKDTCNSKWCIEETKRLMKQLEDLQ